MSSRLTRSLTAGATLLLVFSAPAEAQLSGLKNRVKRAVGGDASAAGQPGQSQSVRYNENVLEITPEVMERFVRALEAEGADRADVARVAAEVRSPEAFQSCVMEFAMSAEGQALMEEMAAKGEAYMDDTSDQAAAAAYQQVQQSIMDAQAKRCGPDPDQFQSSELPKLQARPAKVGQEAGGFTATQYAILKERVAPLCGRAQAGAEGEIRLPGEGKDIYWVYSPVEVEQLLPRCEALTRLIHGT